jgi:hypothetical protein
MTRRSCARALQAALALVVLLPAAAMAQSGIAGIVKDTSGAVLPGVSVEAASPVLIEKVRAVVTDEQGAYRILDLRPGTYDITFTLPGFSTVKREALELPDSFTATVNADLRVGSLEETITVTGASPLVDVQNVAQRAVLDDTLVDSLPTIRFVHTYATLLPAVTGTTFTSNGTDQRKYWSHGGRQADSVVYVDGFSSNFGMPGFGGNSSYFMNSAYVQEVTMTTSAGSAEQGYGGVMSNVIPKEGGNQITGYFYGNYADENMKTDNVDDDLRAHGLTVGTYTIKQFDAVPALGGPLKKDKLWFFVAGENSMVNRSRAGVYYNATPLGWFYTPDLNRVAPNKNTDTDKGLRLTWQASPRNKISAFWSQQIHTYHHRNSDESANSATSSAPESTNFTEEWPNFVSSLVWKSPISNKLLVEAGWGVNATAIPTTPSRDPGYTVDPWSIISATDQDAGFCFRVSGGSGCGGWNQPFNHSQNQRASAAYVTGSHAFKVGFQGRTGNVGGQGNQSKEYSYRLRSGVPNQITQTAGAQYQSRKGLEWGFYGQDQWTKNKFTINLGVRFDHQREWIPANCNPARTFVPARCFDAVEDVPNNWDFSPRVAFAYDVFGNGRTAIKGSVSRYVGQSLGGISDAMDPTGGLSVSSVTRNWTDADRDYEPDCDLNNPNLNGECGVISNLNFGKLNPTNLGYNSDLLTGWGIRIYNWETSVQLDHQINSAISTSVAYFRRSQGNQTLTDNLAVTPADYGHFCVTAPLNAGLPGGGGYQICDNYDISVAKRGQTANEVNFASDYGDGYSEVWNGVDLSTQIRLPGGANLNGGLSTGRVYIDSCAVVDTPTNQYCETKEPFQTSVKFIAHYPLPWYGIELSGTYANVPGQFLLATAVYSNAQIFPSLGRNLSSGANGNVTVNLIAPRTVNMERVSQTDMKVAKTFRVGRFRATPSVDLINLFNANGIEGYNSAINSTWPSPKRIQFGRLAKLNFLMTF